MAAHTYPLTESASMYSHSSASHLPLRVALGDTAVAFDFSPPTPLSRRYKQEGQTGEEGQECVWPIYVLWGNGEVFLLNTSLHTKV